MASSSTTTTTTTTSSSSASAFAHAPPSNLQVPVARTATYIAAGRAVESRLPETERVIYDPWAEQLAGAFGFAFWEHMSQFNFGRDSRPSAVVAIRTKFFDNCALEAATRPRDPVRQIVLLGSGLDTRAYRLPWPEGVTVFEVDFQEVFEEKLRVLHSAKLSCSAVRYVGADLRDGTWESALLAAAFDPSKPSCWLLEGLLMYFELPAVHSLLHGVSRLSSPGSTLVADIFAVASIKSIFVKSYVEAWAAWGAPMHSGTDCPDVLMRQHGYTAIVRQYGDEGANFGVFPEPSAWLAKAVGKDNPNLPRTYLLHCTRDNRSWAELSAKAHSWKSELLLASAKRQLESLRSLVAPENLTSIEEFFKVYENELREVELEKLASADDLD